MNHLLEEIDNLLNQSAKEKWEKEKEYILQLFKDKRKRNIRYSMKALKRTVNNVHFNLLEQYFDNSMIEGTILGKMKKEEKIWLLNEMKKEIETYSFWEEPLAIEDLFEPKIKPIKERVKIVTEGGNVAAYYFLPKKEEERIKKSWIEFLMLVLEKNVGLETEDHDLKIIHHVLSCVSNPYIAKLKLNDLANEKMVDSMKKSDEIKETLKVYYSFFQKKWMKTLVSHVESWNMESVGNVYYLLTDERKQELKKNYELWFQKQLEGLKKEEKMNEKKLKQLKEKIIMVEGWKG